MFLEFHRVSLDQPWRWKPLVVRRLNVRICCNYKQHFAQWRACAKNEKYHNIFSIVLYWATKRPTILLIAFADATRCYQTCSSSLNSQFLRNTRTKQKWNGKGKWNNNSKSTTTEDVAKTATAVVARSDPISARRGAWNQKSNTLFYEQRK